jgi:hypothetical protein
VWLQLTFVVGWIVLGGGADLIFWASVLSLPVGRFILFML